MQSSEPTSEEVELPPYATLRMILYETDGRARPFGSFMELVGRGRSYGAHLLEGSRVSGNEQDRHT